MYDLRRIGAALTALVMTFSLGLTASASGVQGGYSDVDAGAWYAVAVEYVRDNGLMRGTSDTTFEPEGTMTRSMLSATLYRLAGSPAVTGVDAFSDTEEGVWYTDAVLWASQQGLVGGYGNGLFGTNDPVTREQIAVILWRYAGSPAAEAGADFADEDQISGYAAQAVDWARASGVMDGVGGNRLNPKGTTTRAQAAAIFMRFSKLINK